MTMVVQKVPKEDVARIDHAIRAIDYDRFTSLLFRSMSSNLISKAISSHPQLLSHFLTSSRIAFLPTMNTLCGDSKSGVLSV
jgi:hypothetical protein